MRAVILFPFVWTLFAFARPLELEGLKGTKHDWVSLLVTQTGELLAADYLHLYHWDGDGRLLLTLNAKAGTQIIAAFFDGTHYYLSTSDLVTYQFSNTGQMLAATHGLDQFIFKYLPLGDRLLCLPYTNNDTLTESPYFFQVHDLALERRGNALQVRTKALFGKIQPIQTAMQYNLLAIWLVPQGSVTLLVNQLEAKVYRYSPDQIRKEQLAGTMNPTEVTAVPLELVDYHQPPGQPFIIDRPMKRDAYAASRHAWWNSWSRITWFGSHANGFIVAYEVPECEEPSNCSSTRLAIQILDPRFKRLGQPRYTHGLPFGSDNQSRFFVMDTTSDRGLVQVFD